MTEKENKSEAKEEKGGKAVAVQRGALAPFKSFEDRFEQMERFMDRMMGGLFPSRWMRSFEREWPELAELRAPAVDLIDRANEILVRAELPGVKKEDISISLTADSITIQAQSKKEAAEEKRRLQATRDQFERFLPLDMVARRSRFRCGQSGFQGRRPRSHASQDRWRQREKCSDRLTEQGAQAIKVGVPQTDAFSLRDALS
ncbi:Hsp20/alpha crystallin family protein [Candidatus Accumulibacter contiguus]|uniref:Hsp20/alpha crystallin family protein n=1 Tax=Candidatus Accumulibacter contiguus TaxID=2954381 RepID=UPI00207BBC0B|nr:Hsp20/alpha crystallin family protein [Candidatus Accumulibacter contiguus]